MTPGIDDAMSIWESYRKLIPNNLLLPLFATEKERSRIDALYNKIKMNQWAGEELDASIFTEFCESVYRWRDSTTMDILKNGSL